ncbi:hypothetical protein UlMin_023105 [Ulmus minor]
MARKRRKLQNEKFTLPLDRISELPDHVIHRILSFVPTIEVVRMSLVSKHWKRLCYSVPVLHICEFDNERKMGLRKFVMFFGDCLDRLLRGKFDVTSVAVSRLKLDMYGSTTLAVNIDSWFDSVAQANLKELDIFIRSKTGPDKIFNLPHCILSMKSLTLLQLCGMRLEGAESVNLPSLKSLSLDNAQLDDQFLHNLLTGCCSLEKLFLKKCFGFAKPKVLNSSLKSLEILNGCGPCAIFQVGAKNIQSFIFDGGPSYSNFNLSSHIAIKDLSISNMRSKDRGLEDLLLKLPLLESLVLYECYFGYIKICSQHLKNFVFRGNKCHCGPVTIIDTPNLVSFTFEGYLLSEFSMIAPNVLKANIKLCNHKAFDVHWYFNLIDFLSYFNYSKTLDLQVYSEEVHIHTLIYLFNTFFHVIQFLLSLSLSFMCCG